MEEESNEEENNNNENESDINPIFTSDYHAYTDEELISKWATEANFDARDIILMELKRRRLFPSNTIDSWDNVTGTYPNIKDPAFLKKLLAKREFAESLQKTWEPSGDPCTDNTTFEVTPVQRFISNFMSPRTPYNSALLYHGVGVGKTCGAIQIAEAWLEIFPTQRVMIVAPPTIHKGFKRTIFDMSKVTIGKDNEPNTASQCTGDIYMRLTNTLYERDPEKIQRNVERLISKRYHFFGYISFKNYIGEMLAYPAGLTEATKEQYKKSKIRTHFSDKLLIVDEAHNLRDIDTEEDIERLERKLEINKKKSAAKQKSDADNGKLLTPYLRYVLRFSEGMKFAALTATPMYNSHREIIFIFNLLLLNDKQAIIKEDIIFDFKTGELTPKGREIIADISRHYVSFMRGENPRTFPIRLFPEHIPSIQQYPTHNPKNIEIPPKRTEYVTRLPIVPIMLKGDALNATIAFTDELSRNAKGSQGLNTIELEKLVHAGNFVVPSTALTRGNTIANYRARTDVRSLDTVFRKETRSTPDRKELIYHALPADTENPDQPASWLLANQIGQYSPKFEFLLDRLRTAEGCCFVYTRFVYGGALPLALALEANGYTPYGRTHGLLGNGIQSPGGKQCALCPKKQAEHGANEGHAFVAAKYGILTGEPSISPNNEATITAQRAFNNADGSRIKVIIGSQLASEGVDLRFVRETHVLDAWYHLNKTEQILGRAIRFLSHCALETEKRNNTVYLYANLIPNDARESVDLYSYRVAFTKATLIGRVTRIMKQSALDCNLNHDAIIITGQPPVRQIDSQRTERNAVVINDMPFTAVCDWIEDCDYSCEPTIDVAALAKDDSSYDQFSSRWRIHQVKQAIKNMFALQTFFPAERILDIFKDIPKIALADAMNSIVNNKDFQVYHNNTAGYVRYCNGYYIFQPTIYKELPIPLAMRSAAAPIKRDMYIPIEQDVYIPDEEVAEAEEKAEQREEFTITHIWNIITQWIDELTANSVFVPFYMVLIQWYKSIAFYNKEQEKVFAYMVDAMQWFHEAFHISENQNHGAFRMTLMHHFWDMWLSIEDQEQLLAANERGAEECIAYAVHQASAAQRFINPATNALEYRCDNQPCSRVQIDIVLRNKTEPLQTLRINTKTTGELYGFAVPKNERFIFKIDEAENNKRVFKGVECGIVSTMQPHIKRLLQIMEIIAPVIGTFSLDTIGQKQSRVISSKKIVNSKRVCTVTELLLRYMDLIQLRDKRWFYRPVEAYYIGYKDMPKK